MFCTSGEPPAHKRMKALARTTSCIHRVETVKFGVLTMHVVGESMCISLLKSRAGVECKKVGYAQVAPHNRITEILCIVDARCE